MTHSARSTTFACLLTMLLTSCVSLPLDLGSVPVPISAKPHEGTASETVPLELRLKNRLWLHGLFGHTPPDVAAAITQAAEGYDSISDFRVRQAGSFHDWFVTHLSVTLYRPKSVYVTGTLIKGD